VKWSDNLACRTGASNFSSLRSPPTPKDRPLSAEDNRPNAVVVVYLPAAIPSNDLCRLDIKIALCCSSLGLRCSQLPLSSLGHGGSGVQFASWGKVRNRGVGNRRANTASIVLTAEKVMLLAAPDEPDRPVLASSNWHLRDTGA